MPIDYTGTNSTNEDTAASVAPINNGEAVTAGVADDGTGIANRAPQALRIRSELVRTFLDKLEYAEWMDRDIFLSVKPGASRNITWNGTVADGGDGKFTLGAGAELHVMFGAIPTPGAIANSWKDFTSGGAGTLRIRGKKKTYDSPGGNTIDIYLKNPGAANTVLTFTVTGTPARHIEIKLRHDGAVVTDTVQQVVDAISADLTGATVSYVPDYAAVTALISASQVGAGTAPVTSGFEKLSGAFEDSHLRISAGDLVTFFGIGGNPLAANDVLAIVFGSELTRRQTHTGGTNPATPTLITIRGDLVGTDKIPYAVPICRVHETRLIFVDGTSFAKDDVKVLGAGSTTGATVTLSTDVPNLDVWEAGDSNVDNVEELSTSLDAALDSATGHAHDGTPGGGQQVSDVSILTTTATKVNLNVWETTNNVVDNVKELTEAVDRSLHETTGHDHDGTAGNGPQIAAANITVATNVAQLDVWEAGDTNVTTAEEIATAVDASLHSGTGHDHDGTTGNGPKIPATSVAKTTSGYVTYSTQAVQGSLVASASMYDEFLSAQMFGVSDLPHTGNVVPGLTLNTNTASIAAGLLLYGATGFQTYKVVRTTDVLTTDTVDLSGGAQPLLIVYKFDTNRVELIKFSDITITATATTIKLTIAATTHTNTFEDITGDNLFIVLGACDGTAANPAVVSNLVTYSSMYGHTRFNTSAVVADLAAGVQSGTYELDLTLTSNFWDLGVRGGSWLWQVLGKQTNLGADLNIFQLYLSTTGIAKIPGGPTTVATAGLRVPINYVVDNTAGVNKDFTITMNRGRLGGVGTALI